MKKIRLTQGKVALVDDEDYDRVSKHKWFAFNNQGIWYAARGVWDGSKERSILMHRFILNLLIGDGFITDHINRNGLDNRKENLRQASFSLNRHNSKAHKNNSSGYRGVHWHITEKKWIARITINGKRKHLGRFNDPISAANAYDTEIINNFRNIPLNFPGGTV